MNTGSNELAPVYSRAAFVDQLCDWEFLQHRQQKGGLQPQLNLLEGAQPSEVCQFKIYLVTRLILFLNFALTCCLLPKLEYNFSFFRIITNLSCNGAHTSPTML